MVFQPLERRSEAEIRRLEDRTDHYEDVKVVAVDKYYENGAIEKTTRFENGETVSVENVVLVPREAVTIKDGKTYVNVLNEDGSIVPTSFLAGGNDNKYYWVIEGIGIKI